MKGEFYPIGIEASLNRERVRKLLIFGIIGSVLTGAGDFLLGYAEETDMPNFAAAVMSSAQNLADWQMIAGGLFGLFGIFLEGLSYVSVYRLMADASPRYAHIFRTGIFGYIWLAPVGCHLNMGVLNMAYKYLLKADPEVAYEAAGPLFYGFSLPLYILLVFFWGSMIVVQFLAFSRGLTPYPKYARWFNIFTGGIPTLLIAALIGAHTALGAGIGTTFLSVGNLVTFGGLLATLPSEERFAECRQKLAQENSGTPAAGE